MQDVPVPTWKIGVQADAHPLRRRPNHVAYSHDFEEPYADDRGQKAVFRGSLERLNPILMTALTAARMLIPLAIGGDEARKETQSPMAIVLLGGLLSSTALDMIVVPALFRRYGKPARSVDIFDGDVLPRTI